MHVHLLFFLVFLAAAQRGWTHPTSDPEREGHTHRNRSRSDHDGGGERKRGGWKNHDHKHGEWKHKWKGEAKQSEDEKFAATENGVFEESGWNKPVFCMDRACPEYKVLKVTEDYEVREYAPSLWLSTQYNSDATNPRASKIEKKQAFWRLFRYIRGENSAGLEIPMSVPVITEVFPCRPRWEMVGDEEEGFDEGEGVTEGQDVEEVCLDVNVMSFYLGADRQNVFPPQPNDDNVMIEEKPGAIYYVRSFKGWTSKRDGYEKHRENLDALAVAMARDGVEVEDGAYFMAGYGPYKSDQAHNEGWIAAKI